MSAIKVREVNVVPVIKIKEGMFLLGPQAGTYPPKQKLNKKKTEKEKIDLDDESEDTVLCKICSKSFVSEMAVRNHARMEHIDEFMAGEDLYVRPFVDLKRKFTDAQIQEVQTRTSELVSSMQPTALTSLASKDVSYIIIKDQGSTTLQKVRKIEKRPKPEKKEKEVIPISGPFECLQPISSEALCHQMFLSCCEYSKHYRDEHTRRRKGNRCQVCEKPITGNEQLVPFSCQICGMGFDNNKDLTEHSQTAHIKLKPFQCSVCLKRFTQQGGLQQHMRRHTGDRPFPCTYCPKAFTQKSGLDQHLRIHTKVKPYRCVICSKAFCQSVHLQQHMRTHTNVAPFQCGICQKRFKQSSHLNYHLRYHNMIKMTDQQKQKYTDLLNQMLINQEYVEVEVPESESQQELDQSEISEEHADQSQLDCDQSELTHEIQEEEIEQSQMMQDDIDQSEVTKHEIDQSESQHSDSNEEVGQTVYILEGGDTVWSEGVVCEQ